MGQIVSMNFVGRLHLSLKCYKLLFLLSGTIESGLWTIRITGFCRLGKKSKVFHEWLTVFIWKVFWVAKTNKDELPVILVRFSFRSNKERAAVKGIVFKSIFTFEGLSSRIFFFLDFGFSHFKYTVILKAAYTSICCFLILYGFNSHATESGSFRWASNSSNHTSFRQLNLAIAKVIQRTKLNRKLSRNLIN